MPFLLLALAVLVGCGKQDQRNVNSSDNQRTDSLVLPPVDFYPPGYLADSQNVTLTFQPSDEKPVRTAYRLVYPKLDEQYAKDIAGKLGISGSVRYDASGDYPAYKAEDDNGSLTILGGCFTYASPNGSDILERGPEADVNTTVEAFLSQRDLLPKDAEFGPPSRSQDGSISTSAQNTSFPVLFAMYPMSPPFLIDVGFHPDGSLDVLLYCWPELEPIGDYTLLSEREAHGDMLSTHAEPLPRATVKITSFELSYFTATVDENTAYFVPVYCAMGTRHTQDGGEDTGCINPVPAIPADKERRGDPDWAQQANDASDSGY